ncbi:MAG: hypothetical protein U9N50_13945 [Pseudomonadota bacterium]|nr:hypothetical protein [Pseudomonadota bacterium]
MTAAEIAAINDGESDFLLMGRGKDVLAWRIILSDSVQKRIDAQISCGKRRGRQGHDVSTTVCG